MIKYKIFLRDKEREGTVVVKNNDGKPVIQLSESNSSVLILENLFKTIGSSLSTLAQAGLIGAEQVIVEDDEEAPQEIFEQKFVSTKVVDDKTIFVVSNKR